MNDDEKAVVKKEREDVKGWKGRRDTIENKEKLDVFIAKHAKEVARYIQAIYV